MKQTVSYLMGGDHIAESIFDSFENFVYRDIEENILFKNGEINDHFNHVMSTLGNSYNGVNKFAYGNVLQAIKTIVFCKKKRLRKKKERCEAIAFLHQDLKFAPNTIQNILSLFEVKIGIGEILKSSERVFEDKPIPNWIQVFYGGL